MKEDTKKIVLIGGVALAGLYAYSTMGGEDYAGMGGGGGAPLLPSIVEAATGAETAAPTVVYNFPEMPGPTWDTEEDTGMKKNEVSPGGMITYDTPIGPPVSAKSPIKMVDPAYFAGALIKKGPTPEKPVQFSEASVGGFFEFLAPITQIGKGARGRDTLYDPKSSAEAKKISTAQSVVSGLTPYRKSGGVTYGPRGQSYNVPGVTYGGKGGITYSRPAGPPRPKKYTSAGSPD